MTAYDPVTLAEIRAEQRRRYEQAMQDRQDEAAREYYRRQYMAMRNTQRPDLRDPNVIDAEFEEVLDHKAIEDNRDK